MLNFVKRFFQTIFLRSSAQAAQPNVSPQPPDDPFAPPMPGQPQPIESYFEGDRFGPLQMGKVEFAGKDVFDQLVRGSTKYSVLLGCHHLVSQIQPMQTETQKIRGVAGVCHYCDLEIQQEQQRRSRAGEPLMSPADAIRSTLVCTDCAHLSVSGKLCCPRHSQLIDDGNGKQICLGVEEIEAQGKRASIMKVLMPVLELFTEDPEVAEITKPKGSPTPNQTNSENQPNHGNYAP